MSSYPNPSEKTVLVIGASGMDVVARLETPFRDGTSNPASIRTSHGGVARNVAENLARLGHPTCLLSVLGKDESGDETLAYTHQAGVDVSHVHRVDTFPTGFYMGILNPHGKVQFAVDDMRIMGELNEGYLVYHQDLFENASLIFLDVNTPKESIALVFELAKKYSLPVCADPTTRTLTQRLIPHLASLHLVAPNSAEAAILLNQPFDASDPLAAIDAARKLVALGAEIAVITLAEFGVCYATSETSGHFPALRTHISDPTGAGDALTSAVIFALLNDIELDDAIQLGSAAAAVTLRHSGTVVPTISLDMLYDELGR